MSLWHEHAGTLAEAVRGRRVSAVEVARTHLERIAAVDGPLHAFLHLMPERALARAEAVDEAVARGEGAGLPLAGVPVAVKDVLDIAGVPTTCGSRLLEDYRPPFTATAIQRLEQAGAVVVGKTNMDEFAMGSSTENSGYGPTRNPWDTTRVPGGSSGGSAVAVAARMAPLALGSDTGGSIRQPAAFCGVTGLKPTYGRVSRYGLVAYASSLDQVGVIARSADDAALTCRVLFGADPRDATSADRPVPAFEGPESLQGLRIGVPWSFLAEGVDAAVMAAFRAGLDVLAGAGAQVVEVALPTLPHAIATYYLIATAEASSNLARYDGVRYGRRPADPGSGLHALYGRTRDAGFGAEVKRRIVLGTFVLSSGYYDAYYLRAQQARTLIRRDFERAFAACDVVATPTAPTPAFRLGEKSDDPLQMYLADIFTVPANLAGLPGISLPAGQAEGLPVGLQLLGRWFEEETLVRCGRALQAATGHHRLAPPA